MEFLSTEDALALAAVAAIHGGDVDALRALLREHPELATVRLGDACGMSRTLLHVATDWPGHYPNGPRVVETLLAAGADVNARFAGPHTETPLHWAASSDDVPVLDALLDAGADIEAGGSVIGGGTPLSDACAFGQWNVARRLVERGARTELWQDAALGRIDGVRSYFERANPASVEDATHALWCAAHGGQDETTAYLLGRGADINWVGYDDLTPLDAAERSEAHGLVTWLRGKGGLSAKDLTA
ncbi:ankyrin repeat domain-containing protein [Frankia sp. CNm7]|uniref:Ankyrin repeat domain-containing protein n=1 Tax=Frankia nepalensis TaxID=1836974 RepID=A0A937RB86_9ACTN|nr:ankyrin repeat domain-containing protein [Frankia nepalensis]MBL7502428.1 ankyrin repeat domain-containing protein [Frankia nepalensis]MBL7516274.1 ankyrin repeat domain-containing protein [Frankia nepalensis]MBL7520549.1 ankyrin repeat domain-containing protein [Frankia nepalensis]MBL7625729.1 ankyrin repeat domain-containing protein [Frankia nepalensis]